MVCTSSIIFGPPDPFLEMRRFRFAESALVIGPGGSLDAWVACSPATRLAGLAGLRAIGPRAALLIPRCAWIHTWGMRFDLDVAILQWPPARGQCEVLAVATGVGAGRSVRLRGRPRRTAAVLESPANTLFGVGITPGARAAVSRRISRVGL